MTDMTMTHEQEQGAWPHLTKMIHEYIDDYHLEGDEGSYIPTGRERFIAEDIINSMLVDDDMVAAIRAALSRPAVPEGFHIKKDGEDIRIALGDLEPDGRLPPAAKGIAVWVGPSSNEPELEVLYRLADALLAAAPEPADQHPDDAAVDRFAQAMKAKLAQARAKGRSGWDDPAQCSPEYLADLLAGHVLKGNDGNFVDVANFAMMLHQRGAAPSVMPDAIRRSAAEESSADAGEPRRFETAQEFVQWLRSVRAYGSDAEDTWGAAEVAAQAVEGMLGQRQLCPNCGSDIVYEDRADQYKGVKHCDDCGHEFPNPVYVEQEQPEDGPVAAPQRESVTVRYDLSPAQTESAIRDALIRMGWTPPEGESVATVKAERDVLQRENAELRERVRELEAALRDARRDIAGLPRSLGYDLTSLPKIDAVLEKQGGGPS